MKRPLVSVLIPVYNVEKYLRKCLDSVLSQTLVDIEVVCINDGSTDASLQILNEYQKRDRRVVVISKENGGLPSARNAALDVAKGRYVGFVDSDDFVEKNMFEKLYQTAVEHQSDIVICGANIFPEEPRASKWLYGSLSPTYCHYDEFHPEVLFGRIDTNPFLWRTLVKKSLIDSRHFRLDEKIVLGEDKAFQAKLYPAAKGITVIPDKLYNYYWCRPESLMDVQVRDKITKKVAAHAMLIEKIGWELSVAGLSEAVREDTYKAFLEWSIPFIYDDFIYISMMEKCSIAGEVIKAWTGAHYFHFKHMLPEWKQRAFDYIKLFGDLNADVPVISLITPLEYASQYIDKWIKQVEAIDNEAVEFVIVNNGVSNENYIKIQQLLYANPHVRLYNTSRHLSYAETLNIGIRLADGEYLAFFEAQDWYVSKQALAEWLSTAKRNGSDICVAKREQRKMQQDFEHLCFDSDNVDTGYFNVDFHNLLYKKSFLEREKLKLKKYSIITGMEFVSRVLLCAEKQSQINEPVYIMREMFHQDWIRTDCCELVLQGLLEMLELSLSAKNPYLHAKVYLTLNGDMLKHIIANNTKPYRMSSEQCPNGENSQIITVRTLFEIAGKADMNLLRKAGYRETDSIVDTLCSVIDERQKFLATI